MLNVSDLLWVAFNIVLPIVFSLLVLVSMAWILQYSENQSTTAKDHPIGTLQAQSVQVAKLEMHMSFLNKQVSALEKRVSILQKKNYLYDPMQ